MEKLEARRALVELDLEPSGLVIKHDDEGEVERVEPAVVAEKVGSFALPCFAVPYICCHTPTGERRGVSVVHVIHSLSLSAGE